jgi:putative addiction module component (TIGR02574 family)
MMPEFTSVFADASQLPVQDRLQLIQALEDTLPEDANWELSPEWMAEIKRRTAEYRSGQVQTIPWEEIRDAALKRAGVDPDARR